MFRKDKLLVHLIVLSIWWVGTAVLGNIFFYPLTVVVMVLLCLYFSVGDGVIEVNVRNNIDSPEVVSLLKSDAKLNTAVEYACSLNSDDFIRFVRMVVEMRDSKSQKALKEASK